VLSILDVLGGTASSDYAGGERLVVSYDNASSVHERVLVYARNRVDDIDPSFNIRGFQRDPTEVANEARVARIGDAVTSRPVAEQLTDFREVFGLQLGEIEGRRTPNYTSTEAFDTAEALLMVFEASRRGMRLTIPPFGDLIDFSVEWNIS